LALARTDGAIPEIEYRGALWFAAVGLCNGLAVLAMSAALEFGPVAVVSPLIVGYPLVTLLLSRAFLEKEAVGRRASPPRSAAAYCCSWRKARAFGMPPFTGAGSVGRLNTEVAGPLIHRLVKMG